MFEGLENAWIGGHYKNRDWRFISDGIPLREEPDRNTLYPPWRGDKVVKHAGCLLLDRHLANHPVFLEARCERRRSYICTKSNMTSLSIFIFIKINLFKLINV